MKKVYAQVIDTNDLTDALTRCRAAQRRFAEYTQEQVDRIFLAAASAANRMRIPLAKLAVEETGMGVVEDKVIKNHFASEYIYNAYRDTKTCGVIEEDPAYGIQKIAEPIGVVAAVIPTTNPTSTAIFKALLCLKTRNGMILSPHPKATDCTIAAAKVVLEAAVAAGAPEDIIGWIDQPTLELSNRLMRESDLILATGGPGMVKAAYSSGKPALGVGPGNTPALIDDSADLLLAVSSVIHSKTFDNGMICASEQSVVVLDSIYDAVKAEFLRRGCYVLNAEEAEKLRGVILINGVLNAKIVGQTAHDIAALAGIDVPEKAKILIGEVESTELSEPFAHEKLSPILAMYRAADFSDALQTADRLVRDGGYGHTASIYLDEVNQKEKLAAFAHAMKACRVLVNTPSSQGGIGDLYNFKLTPSLTLGCGSWGGNSVSENVGVHQLLNIKTVAVRRENMLWFRAPEKTYFKKGCLPVALNELEDYKRAFIVTDTFLYQNGYTKPIEQKLDEMGITHTTVYNVAPDPTLACAKEGAAQMAAFRPDLILAVGGGSAMDAGKIMWVLYEHPDVDFQDMAMRFCDIRKRVYTFPKMGEKAYFIAIPTTAGTGSELTQAMVISDQANNDKECIYHDKAFAKEAIIDPELMRTLPPRMTAITGFDAFTHSFESYLRDCASPYTKTIGMKSMSLIVETLPKLVKDPGNMEYRENMALAAMLSGISLSNASATIPHPLSEIVGGVAPRLAHGQCLATIYPQFLRWQCTQTVEKCAAVARLFDPALSAQPDQAAAAALPERMVDFLKEIGLYKSFEELGLTEAEREEAEASPVFNFLPFAPKDVMVGILHDSYRF